MTSLAKVEADAVEAERERHEVVITTELVGLCVVSFDQVGYEVVLAPRFPEPAGSDGTGPDSEKRLQLEIAYTPVLGDVIAPPCAACGSPAKDPVITDTLKYACRSCAKPCVGCGRTALSDEIEPSTCHSCSRPVCDTCGVACRRCGQTTCQSHNTACQTCGDTLCSDCTVSCVACDAGVCSGCARDIHHRQYCADHVAPCERCRTEVPADLAQRCHLTGANYCLACALACVECGLVTRRDLLKPAPNGRGLVCPDHLVACGTCGTGLLPRESSHCPGCGKYHCLDEAPVCQECGLPTCAECTPEDVDRCPVCAGLQPVEADDPRLGPAHDALPDVSAGIWLYAEAMGYVVVEWHGRLGAWGRVALSPTGDVLASCRYGAAASLFQEVVSLFRR